MSPELVIVPFRFSNWTSNNYAYLLHDPANENTIVFDPAGPEEVWNVLQERNWKLTHILNTHHHRDHIGGNLWLQEKTNCSIYAAKKDGRNIPGITHEFGEGDVLTIGQFSIQPFFFSGHTISDVCFYIETMGVIFVGDFLFQMGCGRIMEDTHENMFHGLQFLKTLPPQTKIYNCHEYGLANSRFAQQVEPENHDINNYINEIKDKAINQPQILAKELKANPFLRTHSHKICQNLNMTEATELEVFIELRNRKDRF